MLWFLMKALCILYYHCNLENKTKITNMICERRDQKNQKKKKERKRGRGEVSIFQSMNNILVVVSSLLAVCYARMSTS